MTTTDTFFRATGTSPPDEDRGTESLPLPPELVEDLARFLADAIIADIRRFQNLAELQANPAPTVESLSGRHRRRRPGQRQLSTQSG